MRYWATWGIMSKATKNKRKADKIRLIILEGESDKHFFLEYKKKFHPRLLEIVLIGKNLNFPRIDREIKLSFSVTCLSRFPFVRFCPGLYVSRQDDQMIATCLSRFLWFLSLAPCLVFGISGNSGNFSRKGKL